MQDDYPTEGQVLDLQAQVTVPAGLVGWLRRATYAEIGSAAEALDTVAFASDREAHPERFWGPAQSLRESFTLLDAIGWAKTAPPVPVPIDLSEDCWALIRALEGAVEFAEEDVHETSRDGNGRVLACECKRLGELYDLTAIAEARIDMLAVQEGAETIPDLVA
jgi:hypothetical protein